MNRPITMSSPDTGLLAKQTLKSFFLFIYFVIMNLDLFMFIDCGFLVENVQRSRREKIQMFFLPEQFLEGQHQEPQEYGRAPLVLTRWYDDQSRTPHKCLQEPLFLKLEQTFLRLAYKTFRFTQYTVSWIAFTLIRTFACTLKFSSIAWLFSIVKKYTQWQSLHSWTQARWKFLIFFFFQIVDDSKGALQSILRLVAFVVQWVDITCVINPSVFCPPSPTGWRNFKRSGGAGMINQTRFPMYH